MTSATLHLARRGRSRGVDPADRVWPAALAVFAVGVLVNLVGLTQRTLWIDEAATVSASTRGLTGPAGLGELVRHIDLVHLAYYAGMHIWFDVAGYSPFALRAPSAIAAAAAAALMVPLGARLVGLRTGVLAGGVLLATPATLVNATNGRSQAFELLAAVASSLLLVVAASGPSSGTPSGTSTRRRRSTVALWCGYALVSYAGVLLDLWFVFLVVAHVLAVVAHLAARRPGRRSLAVGGATAVAVVGAGTVPFALAAIDQRAQVSWLDPTSLWGAVVELTRDMSFSAALVDQDLRWPEAAAWLSWALAVGGAVWLARRHPLHLALLLPWLLVPAVGLFAVSELTSPTFLNRYLVMSVPALALLVAVALDALVRRWWTTVAAGAVLALALFGAYSWYEVRYAEPYGTDFVVAAREIHAEQATHPGRRAGIVLGQLRRDAVQLLIDYPADLVGVDDLSGTAPPPATFFWSPRPPLTDALARTPSYDVVFYLGRRDGAETRLVADTLTAQGFLPAETTPFHGATLVRWERPG